jgi:hypothetical protein
MSALTALRYRLGFALRETGQAMERLGATLQGINSFQEQSAWPWGTGEGAGPWLVDPDAGRTGGSGLRARAARAWPAAARPLCVRQQQPSDKRGATVSMAAAATEARRRHGA